MDSVVRGDLQGILKRLPLEQSHHNEASPAGTEAERGRCEVGSNQGTLLLILRNARLRNERNSVPICSVARGPVYTLPPYERLHERRRLFFIAATNNSVSRNTAKSTGYFSTYTSGVSNSLTTNRSEALPAMTRATGGEQE